MLLAVLGLGVFLAGLELMVTAVALPAIVADIAGWTRLREASWIINGYLLVSRGDKTPWRLKVRTASFAHVSALGEILEGVRLADLVTVLASMFYVVGDIDR